MAEGDRAITVKVPADMAVRLDEFAVRNQRSKSWIVRQALAEWMAEEQRRHDLTLEAMRSVDEGRAISQEEVERHFQARRESRASK